MSAAGRDRRFLVLVRVGDSSLHPTWTRGPRNFDLAVDYYGSTPGKFEGTCDRYHENKGSKWRGIAALMAENPEYLAGYDAVWLPDDDIATDAATISTMFELHTELGLGLSQPSLTHDSYFTHAMTLHHRRFAVRVTNFVEVMVPLFSREALAICYPTFSESESGWGIDLAWQALLPRGGLGSGILDCLQVRHTRPVGGGTLYDGLEKSPHQENADIAARYGIPLPFDYQTSAALDDTFTPVPSDGLLERLLLNAPRPTLQRISPWDTYLPGVGSRWRRSARPQPAPVPSLLGGA